MIHTDECSVYSDYLRISARFQIIFGYLPVSDAFIVSARYNLLSTLMIEIYKSNMKVKVQSVHEVEITHVLNNEYMNMK